MLQNKQSIRRNERGMAAIVVSVVMMLIISLIVLAMSQNTQREQRQTLDRQLSDQAYYLAESGVNDMKKCLKSTTGICNSPQKNQCDPGQGGTGISPQVGPDSSNQISCLTFDKIPESLKFDSIDVSEPRVVPIISANTGSIDSITVSWDNAANRAASISGDCDFTNDDTTLPQNCDHGGLRFELVPGDPANRQDLQQRTFIGYFLPHDSDNNANAPTIPYSTAYPANQGLIKRANCVDNPSGDPRCTIQVTGLTNGKYYLSVRSLYQPVKLTITAKNGGTNVRFRDAQYVIDSTGRASDVLRRLVVRMPANNTAANYPGFVMQSVDSICKRLEVDANSVSTRDPRCKLD